MIRQMQLLAMLVGIATVMVGCSRSADQPPAEKVVVFEGPSDSMKVDDPPAGNGDSAPPAERMQFPFPDDSGGKALAKTLAPVAPPPMPAAAPAASRERRLAPIHEVPLPTRPAAVDSAPRLPIAAGKEMRPVPLPERVPQTLGGMIPDLPARSELPAGIIVRQQGPDISKPADLPILSARPIADRAPLADPTLDFTAQSVVSPSLPLRTTPAGFIRVTVPDPFEHADAAKPRTPVVEDPNRSLGNPPPPRR